MFTGWVTLRQAQEALKAGRLEEAYRLVTAPEVAGHKKAGELIRQVGQALLARAHLHLRHNDAGAAWQDLRLAEAAGDHSAYAVQLRQQLVQRGLDEVRALLNAGDPGRACKVVDQLYEHEAHHPDLAVLEEIARGWSLALDLTARGELGQAVATLERIITLGPERYRQLEQFRQETARRRRELEVLYGKLHDALEDKRWREVIQVADQVLAIAPQHAEVRKARARAWKAVEPPTLPVVEARSPAVRKPAAGDTEPPRRMLLWIDGVGGYLVCLSPRVSFGQAAPDTSVDIPLYADVSRLHGYLSRDAEGYVLEAIRSVRVNNQPVEKALLRDGDRFTLGENCQLRFYHPVPFSATARLEVVSGHRLPLAVDGVLLMADNCILGPAGDAHIAVPELRRPVVLFRTRAGLGVQAAGSFTVDAECCQNRAMLGAHSTVAGDDFRFTLEPLGPHLGLSRG